MSSKEQDLPLQLPIPPQQQPTQNRTTQMETKENREEASKIFQEIQEGLNSAGRVNEDALIDLVVKYRDNGGDTSRLEEIRKGALERNAESLADTIKAILESVPPPPQQMKPPPPPYRQMQPPPSPPPPPSITQPQIDETEKPFYLLERELSSTGEIKDEGLLKLLLEYIGKGWTHEGLDRIKKLANDKGKQDLVDIIDQTLGKEPLMPPPISCLVPSMAPSPLRPTERPLFSISTSLPPPLMSMAPSPLLPSKLIRPQPPLQLRGPQEELIEALLNRIPYDYIEQLFQACLGREDFTARWLEEIKETATQTGCEQLVELIEAQTADRKTESSEDEVETVTFFEEPLANMLPRNSLIRAIRSAPVSPFPLSMLPPPALLSRGFQGEAPIAIARPPQLSVGIPWEDTTYTSRAVYTNPDTQISVDERKLGANLISLDRVGTLIASEAPPIASDFYKMLEQQNVVNYVTLVKEEEGPRATANWLLNARRNGMAVTDILEKTGELPFKLCGLRIFEAKVNGRLVRHFQFSCADGTSPFDDMAKLAQAVSQYQNDPSQPLCINCRFGIYRTRLFAMSYAAQKLRESGIEPKTGMMTGLLDQYTEQVSGKRMQLEYKAQLSTGISRAFEVLRQQSLQTRRDYSPMDLT